MPNRCIKCNQLSTLTKNKTYYYNGYLPLISFVMGLVFLAVIGHIELMMGLFLLVMIISAITREKQKIAFGLCNYHYKKRLYLGGFWISLFLVSLFSAFWGLTHISSLRNIPPDAYFVIQIAMFMGVPISVLGTGVSLFLARATPVNSDGVSLKGLGKAFINTFKKI